VHAELQSRLRAQGAGIDRFYVCPDAQPSPRRKPAPGMVLEALHDFGTDPRTTPFAGDALRDLEAARSANCVPVLVRTGKGAAVEKNGLPDTVLPVQVYDTLLEAAHMMMTIAGKAG
jgi:D-glycero-D-manno-heptose 1,7-bisphosphate phosphatase